MITLSSGSQKVRQIHARLRESVKAARVVKMPTGDRTFAARLRETVESNRVAVEELRAASGAGDWNPAEDADTWMDYFTQPGYVRNKDANEL